ncbi:Reticulon-domain-containing protein [Paraphysoderma sedebokerense]|nr:Reticulon-domain-containing protein [Paraphysoderma sedebokerense]
MTETHIDKSTSDSVQKKVSDTIAKGSKSMNGSAGDDVIKSLSASFNDLIYWKDPTHSASVLAGSIVSVLTVSFFSSWIFYYTLKTLVYVTTLSFLGLGGMMLSQGIMGWEVKNPLSQFYSNPPALNPQLVQSYTTTITHLINKLSAQLVSLVLVQNPLHSFQFLLGTYVTYQLAYYIPLSVFTIIGISGLFSVPYFLKTNHVMVEKYKKTANDVIAANLKVLKSHANKTYQQAQDIFKSKLGKQTPIVPEKPSSLKAESVDAVKKEE